MRVLIVGEAAGASAGAPARLAIAARNEGFATTRTTAAGAEDALGEAHPHAILVDAHDPACDAALVARLVAAALVVPIVVVGPDHGGAVAGGAVVGGAVAWIDSCGCTRSRCCRGAPT